jgi:xylulose-5-phosphate/fructose-6-phosphate phosphoketolase
MADPTILARKSNEDLANYFEGLGWNPYFVEGTDPQEVHEMMAKTLDAVIEDIKEIQAEARKGKAEEATMPAWPVILFRTPKGWTGPETWNGEQIAGTFRAHQVPIPVDSEHMEHIDKLVNWLKSYRPEELFDEKGKIKQELRVVSPTGDKRMAKNPITNGGIEPKPMKMPDWKQHAIDTSTPGAVMAQDMIVFGQQARDMITENPTNFRIFGPDETKSNRLNKVFEVTDRQWLEPKNATDEWQSSVGRVIDGQLSEHQAEGFLEGYVLTGRHGFFASYESFLRVVDSMLTQHFKWMRKASAHSWRKKYPALNVIATSTVFQQDHNGYTHQDPGILTHLAEKKPEFIREYLPADANSLMAVMDKAMQDEQVINLIVSSKHPRPQFYSAAEAEELVEEGLKVIDWASTDNGEEPDVVIAAAGTEPNLEALAAVSLLNKNFPELKIRFVNVVDILKLRHPDVDPRGLSDEAFDAIFTTDKPIVFAFHGYEGMVRDIFFDRHNHNIHIHGYRENGDITTPFDMRVFSEMDRFHLAQDAANAAYGLDAAAFSAKMDETLQFHHDFIRENGTDIPEVANWKWETLKQLQHQS